MTDTTTEAGPARKSRAYYLAIGIGVAFAGITVLSGITGTVFAFTLDPSESSDFRSAGRWSWVLTVTDADGQKVTVCDGTTNILEDLTAAGMELAAALDRLAAAAND